MICAQGRAARMVVWWYWVQLEVPVLGLGYWAQLLGVGYLARVLVVSWVAAYWAKNLGK